MGRVYYCGPCTDVSKGEYASSPVTIKHLRMNEGDYNRVSKYPQLSPCILIPKLSPSGYVERLSDVGEI